MEHNFAQLQKKLAKVKRQEEELSTSKRVAFSTFASSSFSVALELMAGVFVGIIIGYIIDELCGSKPVGLLVCMMLGFTAGFYNIYRSSMKNSLDKENKNNE